MSGLGMVLVMAWVLIMLPPMAKLMVAASKEKVWLLCIAGMMGVVEVEEVEGGGENS